MAFGDRKKKKYRDFAEDINGEIVYNGDMFNYGTKNRLPYRVFRQRASALSFVSFASVVSAGTFAAPGTTDRFYIILPLLAAIITSALMCYSVIGVLSRGEALRRFDVDGRLSRSKGESMLSSVFSAAALAAYAANYLMSGRGEYDIIAAAGFPILILLSLCSEYGVFRLLKDTVWDKQKKD